MKNIVITTLTLLALVSTALPYITAVNDNPLSTHPNTRHNNTLQESEAVHEDTKKRIDNNFKSGLHKYCSRFSGLMGGLRTGIPIMRQFPSLGCVRNKTRLIEKPKL